MRPRTPLLLVVASLLLVGTLTGSASPIPEEPDVKQANLLSSSTHVPMSSGTDECGGSAPDTTLCSTGTHLILGGHASHGFPTDQGSFTGTLETRIQSLVPPRDEARAFRCDFDDGQLVDCSTSGSFPATPSLFVHTCHAYETGTDDVGGSGSWTCTIDHE